jgi:hypothetical protein
MKGRMKAREKMEKGEGTTCKNGIPLFARLGVDICVLLASLSSVGAEGAKSSVKGSSTSAPSAPSSTVAPYLTNSSYYLEYPYARST